MTSPKTIPDVVESGLCIGCGLCEALAPNRWRMVMTPKGRLRPAAVTGSAPRDDSDILDACPGAVAKAPAPEAGAETDTIWGAYLHMGEAWAGDPDIRYRAATGGVLTALGQHLLRTGQAEFILHVGADPDAPMRSRWGMSETVEEVAARAGSRYGPTDTLAGLEVALAREVPFAVICKPCDAGALRRRAKADPRIDRLCVAVLVMVCGGASELSKSKGILEEEGMTEPEVSLFRYRGYGNPGPLRVETRDGRSAERSYGEVWGGDVGWALQSRCKICPDALGEAADIAAADIWPGGSPTGDDEGFNGVIVRSIRGKSLFNNAISDGALVQGKDHTPRDYDDFQPHQVRLKRALAARLRGLSSEGQATYRHAGLRIDALDAADPAEEAGAAQRARVGKFSEEMPQED